MGQPAFHLERQKAMTAACWPRYLALLPCNAMHTVMHNINTCKSDVTLLAVGHKTSVSHTR